VCGPSGVGKSTLIARLRAEYPDDFGFSVSHTTRAPRPGEEDGVAYFFTSKPEMEAGIAAGRFLEHAHVHGNLYGTSFDAIERVARAGRVCILDIDVQGVASCRRAGFPIGKYIFVAPPDTAVLETRLRGRGEWRRAGGGAAAGARSPPSRMEDRPPSHVSSPAARRPLRRPSLPSLPPPPRRHGERGEHRQAAGEREQGDRGSGNRPVG
jgi:guanylate kinase